MTDKEKARSIWRNLAAEDTFTPQWGKAAERLRSLKIYQEADTVFATPDRSLHQARINCLVDGKNLAMPGPSIREGFYLLPARSVPFKDLAAAVTYKGLPKNGQLLKITDIGNLSVNLLLTGSLTIDREGGRIADGNGFFDLCCALLQEFGGLQRNWAAMTFISEDHISLKLLPQDAWDIKIAGAISQVGIHTFDLLQQEPRIFWEMLTMDRMRRIDPLWKLYSEKRRKNDRVLRIRD
jgi:5-formyltetrahydrofolate cyclo-ligase